MLHQQNNMSNQFNNNGGNNGGMSRSSQVAGKIRLDSSFKNKNSRLIFQVLIVSVHPCRVIHQFLVFRHISYKD
jgi:hypothetical protein